jgi:hypothetical protein
MNFVTINPKYRGENVYCHFYGMLIYIILCGLCLANEWNAFINSHNDIVKSIENLITYTKKNFHRLFLAMKKLGRYTRGHVAQHAWTTLMKSLAT